LLLGLKFTVNFEYFVSSEISAKDIFLRRFSVWKYLRVFVRFISRKQLIKSHCAQLDRFKLDAELGLLLVKVKFFFVTLEATNSTGYECLIAL